MRRDERGESLIEVMITLLVIGSAIAALVAGLTTAITASSQHRTLSEAEILVRDAAELLRNRDANGIDYVDNAASYSLGAIPDPDLADFAWEADVISFLNPADPDSTQATDGGLQVVRVTVESSDGDVHETVDVVKRKP